MSNAAQELNLPVIKNKKKETFGTVFQNCSKSLTLQQYHFRYFFDSFQTLCLAEASKQKLRQSYRFYESEQKFFFFLASSGGRSPKQSVSESLPDEDQEDAAATSPKPKVDEASKKGQSHQKSTFHNTI